MVTQDRPISRSNGHAVSIVPPLRRMSGAAEPIQPRPSLRIVPSASDAGLSVLSVAGWVFVFTAGVTMSSLPYRNLLENGKSATEIGMALLAVLLTFTPPNVAILCCVSGVIGEQTRRLSRRRESNLSRVDTAPRGPIASALLRGFCVFIAILAGVLVLSGSQIITPSQDQYVRLAGTGSLLAFLAGFRPRLVAQLLKRVASMFGGDSPTAGGQPCVVPARKRKLVRT
jgi:hypothetical protein